MSYVWLRVKDYIFTCYIDLWNNFVERGWGECRVSHREKAAAAIKGNAPIRPIMFVLSRRKTLSAAVFCNVCCYFVHGSLRMAAASSVTHIYIHMTFPVNFGNINIVYKHTELMF